MGLLGFGKRVKEVPVVDEEKLRIERKLEEARIRNEALKAAVRIQEHN